MNPKTVEFLAKKVAATSGDARTFLELVSSAIEECRENLPPSKLAADEGLKLPWSPGPCWSWEAVSWLSADSLFRELARSSLQPGSTAT